MYDLLALAFQTDSTRVVTFAVRRRGRTGRCRTSISPRATTS